MNAIRIAAAQFEISSRDKRHNLQTIGRLVEEAVRQQADIVSFPEVCIPDYSFLRHASRETIHSTLPSIRFAACWIACLAPRNAHTTLTSSLRRWPVLPPIAGA